MVEKTHPDGYMILNGHHRWAAAMRADMKKIRIKVINLTSDSDLQKMLSASGFERSASLDLDEVLFVNPQTHKTEPQLPFPMKYLYPERLRLGTPELIRSLQRLGYEVWVYTSSFRSESYIRQLFRQYGVRFNSIVNGQRHEKEVQGNSPRRLPQKMPMHYRISLHIDDEEVICTAARQYGFRAYQLNAEDDDWKEKIIERAAQIRKLEHFE